jgi:DNA gyrase/topoisomerase IV subunit A
MIWPMVTTEVRRSIEARLAVVDILLSAAQRQREFLDVMTDAADDQHAVAALRLLFECTEVQAVALLTMQLRRFAIAERARVEAERDDLVAELDSPAADPELPQIAAGWRLVTQPRPKPSPPARRSLPDAAQQHAAAVAALVTATADAQAVVSLVGGARDVPDASGQLQSRYGWDDLQASVVLDMQLRMLSRAGRAGLDAALRE